MWRYDACVDENLEEQTFAECYLYEIHRNSYICIVMLMLLKSTMLFSVYVANDAHYYCTQWI